MTFSNRFVKRSVDVNEDTKEKRDTFLTPIRQTIMRPAVLNRVVQPIIHDVVQPVVTQKVFKTIVNPTRVQQQFGQTIDQGMTFSNRFVKRSVDVNEDTKEKRDTFLTPIRQTIMRPAVLNRVVQPIIQDVVQPVITQKVFKTVVNPTRVQHRLGNTVDMGMTFSNRFVRENKD